MKRNFIVLGALMLLLMLTACGDANPTANNTSNFSSAPLPTVTPLASTPMADTSAVPPSSNPTPVPIVVTNTPVPSPVIAKQPAQPSVNVVQPNNDANGGDDKGQAKGDDKNKGNGKGGDKKPKK